MSLAWQYRTGSSNWTLTSILHSLPMTKKTAHLSPGCLPSPSLGSLFHTIHPGFPPISESQSLAGHLYLDVLTNTKLLCSPSVNYFSPKHTFPTSRFLELPTIGTPRPWHIMDSTRYSFPLMAFLLHPALVEQIASMLPFLKRILFSISSYPSPNPGHSTTVTA